MAKIKIKYDLLNLDKLMESASTAEEIGKTVKDDSIYNVVTKEGTLTESVDSDDFSNELGAILESSKNISRNYTKSAKTKDTLENEVDKMFSMLEAVSPDMTSNQDLSQLKGKKVLMRNGEGKEMPAVVANVNDKTVTLKGMNGGLVNISLDGFRNVFVKVMDTVEKAPALESEIVSPEEATHLEAKKMPKTEVKTHVESEETKKEPTMDKNTEVKESSPVEDVKKVQENPSGELTEPGKIEFAKLPVVEHDKFVKDALAAKNGNEKDAEHNMAPKFKPSVELKLLKHADKYRTFVESFKDGENDATVNCILEAWDAYVSYIKSKN